MIDYAEITEEIIKLINIKKRATVDHLCEIRAHNYLIDRKVEEYNRALIPALLPTTNLNKRSTGADEKILSELETLVAFVRNIFTTNPHIEQSSYLFYAKKIVSYAQEKLNTHVVSLKQVDAWYERELEQYRVNISDPDRSPFGPGLREPKRPDEKYQKIVDKWEFFLSVIIDVLVNRGIPG